MYKREEPELFPEIDEEKIEINLCDDIFARTKFRRVKLDNVPNGNYRVIIGDEKSVRQSLGVLPKNTILKSAAVYSEFKNDGSNLYLQRHR